MTRLPESSRACAPSNPRGRRSSKHTIAPTSTKQRSLRRKQSVADTALVSMDVGKPSSEVSENFKLFDIVDYMDGPMPFRLDEEVYHMLEIDPNHLATCSFASLLDSASSPLGIMQARYTVYENHLGVAREGVILDPFNKKPYTLAITSLTAHNSLSFTGEELALFPKKYNGGYGPVAPGLVAMLQLQIPHNQSDIYYGAGYLKSVKAWSGKDEDGKPAEIFDVYFQLDLEVNPQTYRHVEGKHKSSHRHRLALWAIRSSGNDDATIASSEPPANTEGNYKDAATGCKQNRM